MWSHDLVVDQKYQNFPPPYKRLGAEREDRARLIDTGNLLPGIQWPRFRSEKEWDATS